MDGRSLHIEGYSMYFVRRESKSLDSILELLWWATTLWFFWEALNRDILTWAYWGCVLRIAGEALRWRLAQQHEKNAEANRSPVSTPTAFDLLGWLAVAKVCASLAGSRPYLSIILLVSTIILSWDRFRYCPIGGEEWPKLIKRLLGTPTGH